MKIATSIRVLSALLVAGAMGVSVFAQAPAAPPQGAPQPGGPRQGGPRGPQAPPQALTYELAVQVIDAAEAEARKNNWNMTIVVVDATGMPVVLRRMTNAMSRSYDLATRKAATVVATKMTTAEYGVKLKEGTVQEVPNGVNFAGGVPIMRGDEFIGAIGTSGATAQQDEIVSKAGAAVIK